MPEEQKTQFSHLIHSFLEAMDEIGAYGARKYVSTDFMERAKDGDYSRIMDRNLPEHNIGHAREHGLDYLRHKKHDHFGTLKHQLAAVAFNAMMEYHFARLEETEP
jgi:hypothetical protein